MKINDIILEEEVIDEYTQIVKGVHDELKKKGYLFLGSGVDQAAYIEPQTGCVLKIFGASDTDWEVGKGEFHKGQKMFFRWADYCMKHVDNPFLTKFHGYESFEWGGKMYLQIRQERLYKSSETFEESDPKVVADLGRAIKYSSPPLMSLKELFIRMQENYENAWNKNDRDHGLQQLKNFVSKYGEKRMQLLFDTLSELVEIGGYENWGWDLHKYNSMMRGDQVVIVDPYHLG